MPHHIATKVQLIRQPGGAVHRRIKFSHLHVTINPQQWENLVDRMQFEDELGRVWTAAERGEGLVMSRDCLTLHISPYQYDQLKDI